MSAEQTKNNLPLLHEINSGVNELLTTGEAADVFRVSRATIHRAVKAGRLHPLRTPGGHLRFRRTELAELLRGAS